MIILFAYRGSFLDLVYYLTKNWNQKYKILDRFNKFYFEKANCIIPFGIESQIILNRYPQYKHKFFVCNNDDIYNKLEDKISFYNFIKKSKILNGTGVNLITTYTKNYNGPNIKQKFIVKHKQGAGSIRNRIVNDYIYNLINKYSDTHQIQDIINVYHINGINGISKNGEVLHMLDFRMKSFIDQNYYNKDNKEILNKVQHKLSKIVSKIIKKIKYSGFFEFEFITDKNKNIYLMECNPRISGNLKSDINNEKYPYIENFINRYCNIIYDSDIKYETYKDKYLITFRGNLKIPDGITCSCGCGLVKFDFCDCHIINYI